MRQFYKGKSCIFHEEAEFISWENLLFKIYVFIAHSFTKLEYYQLQYFLQGWKKTRDKLFHFDDDLVKLQSGQYLTMVNTDCLLIVLRNRRIDFKSQSMHT